MSSECLKHLISLVGHAPVFHKVSGGDEFCILCGMRFGLDTRSADGTRISSKDPLDHKVFCPWSQARMYLDSIGHKYGKET